MTLEPLRIRILDALEERPMGIRELAEMTGGISDNVRYAIHNLLADGQIERVNREQSQASGAMHMRVYAIRGACKGLKVEEGV